MGQERSRSARNAPKSKSARTCAYRKARLCRILPDRLGHCGVLQEKRTFLSRGAAARRTPLSAMHWKSQPSIRSGWTLLFERFLSESRGEWPDIDLDLPSEEQARAGHSVCLSALWRARRGYDGECHYLSGQIGGTRSGKALGFDPESLQRLSSLVANFEWKGPKDTMAHSFQNAGFDIKHPRIAKYLELCMQDSGPATASGTALRRHGDLPGPIQSVLCRWSARPCRAAPSSSGIRKTAPTWASSR